MPRRKDQAARRLQVEAAAERALARHGARRIRITDVAAEAGLSTGAVLYYYPTRASLIRVAFHRAFDRFVEHRRATAAAAPDPASRLAAVLAEGFPSGHDDPEVVALYTGVQAIRDDADLAAIVREVTERQVALYREILVDGTASGAFRLAGDAETIARNIVALEDAYGLYAVGVRYPVRDGLRATRSFVEHAVGRPLPATEG